MAAKGAVVKKPSAAAFDDMEDDEILGGESEPAAGKDESGKKKEKEKKEKKEKSTKNKNTEKKAGGVRFLPVFFGVLVVVIAFLAVVVAFNPFGLRDRYLAGVIAKIPVLNSVVAPKEQTAEPVESVGDLRAEIGRLNVLTDNQNNTIKSLQDSVDNYKRELEPLRDMQQQIIQFKADKEEFDAAVAKGDKKAYAKWYEDINPDTAQELYKEVIGENAKDKAATDFLNKIKGMDAKSVAAAFEQLKATDMDLIVRVMNRFDQETASAVLNALSAETAASVIRQLEPANFGG